MANFYTITKCELVRLSARVLRMKARPDFWGASSMRLAEVMNGCGPDSWTDSMRTFASWVYRNYPEAIAIHDWDFEHSDGLLPTLQVVNDRFHSNNKLKLDDLYPLAKPWLYPIRAWAWSKLQFAFVALKNGSEPAWIDAHKRLHTPE
jgi:hypothetical protein